MLVLSRKKGERIRITGEIFIEVCDIRSDKVRLGIVAPDDVAVHREEIWNAIQREADEWKKQNENHNHNRNERGTDR